MSDPTPTPDTAAPTSRTIKVVWAPTAIQEAVDRVLALLADGTLDGAYRVGGHVLTAMDLACLVDAGRQFLADEPAARSASGTPTPNSQSGSRWEFARSTPDWSALCDAAEEFTRAYRGGDDVDPWPAIDKIRAALGGRDPYNSSLGSGAPTPDLGLCDGCDTSNVPVKASDDGRGQFCALCLYKISEQEAGTAALTEDQVEAGARAFCAALNDNIGVISHDYFWSRVLTDKTRDEYRAYARAVLDAALQGGVGGE